MVWKNVEHQLHFQHCYRWPAHSELWPQAFMGLFPSLKYLQESKATRTAQTWMPTPWPPPALSRYTRHPPASLCPEPGAFCFCQKDFSKLLSSDADWLICNTLSLGNAHTLSGIASYQLLMGTWQSRFQEYPKIQDKLCWRKDSGILELQVVELCGYAQ